MVLELLTSYKDKYKRFISEYPSYNEIYKWESLKNFQDRWNIDAPDFYKMYNDCLTNSLDSNLWAAQFFFPKASMLKMIEHDKERVRSMFRELFDESLNITPRIDHFVYHCDQMRDEINKSDEKFKKHFHDGFRIVSVYLCFRFPMKYTIYKYTEFKDFMEKVQAKSIPGTHEIERFFKVMRTVYKFLSDDTELLAIHKKLRRDPKYYQEESLMLAQDFYWCINNYDIDNYKPTT